MNDVEPPVSPTEAPKLTPLPYQRELVEYLKRDERALWEWFSANGPAASPGDAVRLELLKTAYRVSRDQKPVLYELAEAAARKLGISCPLTLYQAQNFEKLNVSLAYIPREAHVVLHGPVQEALNEEELRAVFAHELTHFLFYEGWNGDFAVAEQILLALANDPAVEAAHLETLRRFALYGEILADRGSFLVSENPLLTIAGLLKIEVGDKEVSAESYLEQANEIFAKESPSALGDTHPETFIRTRALQLWAESNDEAEAGVRSLIEGSLRFHALDLLGRKRVTGLTRRLIDRVLAPRWMQTERNLAHARLYFEDFEPVDEASVDERLALDLADGDEHLRSYYAYVLLDFIAADRDLEDAPLAAALTLAEPLGLQKELAGIAAKELKIEKRRIEKIRKDADVILERARKGTDA